MHYIMYMVGMGFSIHRVVYVCRGCSIQMLLWKQVTVFVGFLYSMGYYALSLWHCSRKLAM